MRWRLGWKIPLILTGLVVSLGSMMAGQPETVVYAKHGGEELHLDLYRPAKSDKPTAAILMVHGGGWVSGDRRDMRDFSNLFAQKGIFCASVQYRFAPKHHWPAQLDDVQTAVRYLRAHAKEFNIDPNRIGAIGGSAGGHLVQCLGVRDTRDPHPTEYAGYSSQVKAVWNMFGPSDFTKQFGPSVDGLKKQLLGDVDPQKIRDVSPVNFASKKSAPTYFLQGKKDELVPWQNAVWMADALRAKGVEADLNLIEGMGHSPDMSIPAGQKAILRGIDWMIAHLK